MCSNLYEVIIISAGPGSYKCSSPAARGFDGKWEKAKIPSNIESRYFVLSFYLVALTGLFSNTFLQDIERIYLS